jgi:site-specific DNA-adenine methylase
MPFRYFGGKKALARHYPVPVYCRIVEPFAGSAGYSLWHATPNHEVILIEKDARVVALWNRLKRMSVDELMGIECPPLGSRCFEPLINLTSASENTMRSCRFHDAQVTGRMIEKWPGSRAYIAQKLDLIRNWTILEGNYDRLIPIGLGREMATYFIDPPYAPRPGQSNGSRGDGYAKHCNSRTIDYARVAEWCRSRRGQVIVCEQAGAAWLPFVPFRKVRTTSSTRTIMASEVIWVSNSN